MQKYDAEGGNYQINARAQLIDTVRNAGDVGFETLVRALARNDQERLARQLDEQLAERFIKKLPAIAGISSSLLLQFCHHSNHIF